VAGIVQRAPALAVFGIHIDSEEGQENDEEVWKQE
jgi:hypothetical protein